MIVYCGIWLPYLLYTSLSCTKLHNKCTAARFFVPLIFKGPWLALMDRPGIILDCDLDKREKNSRWTRWFKWLPTSNNDLVDAEQRLLQRLGCRLDKFFVSICDSSCYLRTIVARNYHSLSNRQFGTDPETAVPIVLIHGFAAGCGLWCKNLDSLSKSRPVYAFDLLGFGRSSRPVFPNSAEEVEEHFVQIIDEWREKVGLDKFILLGHSMGGFLSTSYALSHPERVVHLILADPWGFVGRDSDTTVRLTGAKAWIIDKLTSFRALSTLRMLGPFGPKVFRSIRQDFEHVFYQIPEVGDEIEIEPCSDFISKVGEESAPDTALSSNSASSQSLAYTHNLEKSESTMKNSSSPFDPAVVYNYMYHINAQYPSGEDAFLNMSHKVGWAARPMLNRISSINKSIPISFIYGARSWIDMHTGLHVRSMLPENYVDVMVINGGGHQAYAQYAEEFNAYVNAITSLVDQGHKFKPGSEALVQAAVSSGAQGEIRRQSFPSRVRHDEGSGSPSPVVKGESVDITVTEKDIFPISQSL